MTREQQIRTATVIRSGQTTYTFSKPDENGAVAVRQEHHESINAAKRKVRELLKSNGGHAVALRPGEHHGR